MSSPAYRTYAVNVAEVEQISPSFVRVTFRSEQLADIGWDGPDQRIKVVFPLPDTGVSRFPAGQDWYARWRSLPTEERNPMRTYTIRRADRAARELVVDFVAHGDSGPASRWVSRVRIGDELAVIAPDATSDEPARGHEWRPGQATQLLLAGDETAVPAISAILESLADDATGTVFLEVSSTADQLDLRAPADVSVSWHPRDRESGAGYGRLLDAAVREWATCLATGDEPSDLADVCGPDAEVYPDLLWEVPDDPRGQGLYAWLAGEAGAITALRRHLVRDLGVDRSRVAFMGYWKIGRPGS
jgi:NADPH-dependent ferric siderophore reductase